MNEIKYPSDDFLHAQADASDEMKKLALEGISLLFIDCLKGK
jgi:hypothetical protein